MAEFRSNCAIRSGHKRKFAADYSEEEKQETITAWKKAFKSFSCQRQLKLPMKRTLMVHWNNFTEGFFVRESEEILFRALGSDRKICYSGDMFDSWTYFCPVELKRKEWYSKNKEMKEVTDENILLEIHHLTMAFKVAQLEEFPDSYTDRMDVQAQESGYSGSQAEDSLVRPSHMACLYWEAKAQGFSDLRGKLFAEAFLKLLFTGIENVNVSYSTTGCDSYLDQLGYIQDGPIERSSECSYSDDHNPSLSTSKDKYRSVLKNSKNIAFDLKADSWKATSAVYVSIGDNLVLIAEVANVSDSECKRIQQLHIDMLLRLNKHKTLFGLLIQGHQVYLAEYTFDQTGGYKREFSQKAFKYQKEDLKLLYSYLQTHFLSK